MVLMWSNSKLNILIDDTRNTVLSLSRIKADIVSHTTVADSTNIASSHNWMAPERLTGGIVLWESLCDVYVFRMVI
jgi:hypothetical protein